VTNLRPGIPAAADLQASSRKSSLSRQESGVGVRWMSLPTFPQGAGGSTGSKDRDFGDITTGS